ncbi:MAG: polyamine aminopropyltransferase [Planctomycetota bacterium]|nr:MAG: polyamine aminopropyltransferase [Planctomycetota bacterium]
MSEPDPSADATEGGLPHGAPARLLILFSVFVIGACGLMYELIAGAVASYLLGDSVTMYSLVIGVFLAAMGFGSFLTQWIRSDLLGAFLRIQLAVGVVGGFSGLATFAAFAHTDEIMPVVLGLCGVVGALVGMEIPLVIRLMKEGAVLRVNVAQVLSVDYLGALAASTAFPFLVLPLLGLTRAALLIGMFNILIASFGIAMFWRDLPGRRALCGWTLVCGMLLIGGFAAAGRATTWLEDRLYQDEVILAETTPYQRIVITRWQDDIRLFLNGHLQFSAADEYRYHEALVVPGVTAASRATRAPLRVLLLGGGDGLAVRELLRHAEVEQIDLVDNDRRDVELFRDNPLLRELNGGSLTDPRVACHYEDAFVFLRNLRAARYDLIVMDLPDPSGVETSKLYSRTFFGLALRKLTPRGVLVTQASSPFYAREAYWCVVRTIESAVGELPPSKSAESKPFSIIPYHSQVPSFGDWGFVMAAAKRPAAEHWPPPEKTRYLTYSVFERALVFAPDSRKVETEINELDDPVLVRYHNAGWSRWNQ